MIIEDNIILRRLVVGGCVVAWSLFWTPSLRADATAAVQRIKELGGNVKSEGEGTEGPIVRVYIPGGKASDDDLHILKELPHLRDLSLSGQTAKSPPASNGRITDAGMRQLAGLTQLESLALTGNRITDAGLKELRSLEKLRHLDLSLTRVTDEGLQELQALPNLETLRIWDVKITDAGLAHLHKIKSLKRLALAHSRVTERGLTLLREALPGIKAENTIYGR